MSESKYIHLTNLPEDEHFDWRIHYSGSQKAPYGGRVIFLTGGEMDAVVKQYFMQRRSGPTYWNGEPAQARKCLIRCGVVDPGHWALLLTGKQREAVEVVYNDETFYLDNADGEGWYKVTEGMGSPRWAHRGLHPAEVLEYHD